MRPQYHLSVAILVMFQSAELVNILVLSFRRPATETSFGSKP